MKKLLEFIKKYKFLLIGAIVIVAFLVYRSSTSSKENYNYYTVEKRNITETLELSGEIKAKKIANLKFLAGGLVTYAPFEEGDQVKRFQTVASLDQRQLKLSLERQLNLYAKQRHTFDQTQDDYEKEIDDGDIDSELRRILEKAQYDLENSVIDVELQDLSIRLSRIYSPIDGILISSPITTDNVNVLASDVFTIVDPLSLYFDADIDESDLPMLTTSLPATLDLDAYPEMPIETSISYISFSSKETSTGTTYEVDFPIPDDVISKLRLGLNGTASVVISSKSDILTLPIEAVSEDLDGEYVFVLENGEMVEKPVELGISDNNYIEIISGLSEGDQVVTEK